MKFVLMGRTGACPGKGGKGLTVDQLWGLSGSLGSNATIVTSSSSEVAAGGLLLLFVGGNPASLWVTMLLLLLLLLLVTETGLTFSVTSVRLVFSIVSLKSSQEGTESQHHQREYGRPEGFPGFRSSGAQGTVFWMAA
jgi:hypothetical protein